MQCFWLAEVWNFTNIMIELFINPLFKENYFMIYWERNSDQIPYDGPWSYTDRTLIVPAKCSVNVAYMPYYFLFAI